MIRDVVLVTLTSSIGLVLVFIVGSFARTTAPATVGYLAHLAAALAVFVFAGLAVPDAVLYDQTASHTAPPGSVILPIGKEGWTTVLTGMYDVFGRLPAVGLIINVTIAGLTVVLFALIARQLGLPERRTAWFVALVPSGILWSSLLLRESFTWFFVAGCLLGFALIANDRLLGGVVISVVSLAGLFEFRGTAAIILAASGLVAIPLARRQWLLLVSAILAAAALTVSPLGSPIRNYIGTYTPLQILVSREWLSQNATTGFPVDNIWNVATRVLLGPAPWEWPTVGSLLAGDGILWVVVLVLAIWGSWLAPDRHMALLLIIPALLLLASLALTSGNYGTMQRLRAQPELILLPLAAAGSYLGPGRSEAIAKCFSYLPLHPPRRHTVRTLL